VGNWLATVASLGRGGEGLSSDTCWACGSDALDPIFAVKGIPLSSLILMESRDEAKAFPRGDLELVVCSSCGFIYNGMFQPEVVDYTLPYESSQDFSPRFRRFKAELINHLVKSYDLAGREILEIGCGDASFLEALCKQAGARGFGIDPNFDVERISPGGPVTGVRAFYDADTVSLTGDLICCRHTLEHIQPVAEFVGLVKRSAERRPDSIVFFEVPDTDRILDEGAFWDVYYEHCSYFTLPSLANLFKMQGFDVLRLQKGYDDQYLVIDCRLGSGGGVGASQADIEDVVGRAATFREMTDLSVRSWRELVSSADEAGRKVVLWGASSKAVAFVASIDADDTIEAAVDINPFKQNKYLPGSGHPVIGPDSLVDVRPDVVVVMNPVYISEITGALDDLGLSPEVYALGEDGPVSSHSAPGPR